MAAGNHNGAVAAGNNNGAVAAGNNNAPHAPILMEGEIELPVGPDNLQLLRVPVEMVAFVGLKEGTRAYHMAVTTNQSTDIVLGTLADYVKTLNKDDTKPPASKSRKRSKKLEEELFEPSPTKKLVSWNQSTRLTNYVKDEEFKRLCDERGHILMKRVYDKDGNRLIAFNPGHVCNIAAKKAVNTILFAKENVLVNGHTWSVKEREVIEHLFISFLKTKAAAK